MSFREALEDIDVIQIQTFTQKKRDLLGDEFTVGLGFLNLLEEVHSVLNNGDEVFFDILFLDQGNDFSGELSNIIDIVETRVGVVEGERIDLVNKLEINTATVEERIEGFSSSVSSIQETRD